jgi:hypothetical protein
MFCLVRAGGLDLLRSLVRGACHYYLGGWSLSSMALGGYGCAFERGFLRAYCLMSTRILLMKGQ